MRSDHRHNQMLYPVVDTENHLVGVVTREDLLRFGQAHPLEDDVHSLSEIVRSNPVKAYADEPLRAAVHRMAETGFTRLPVVERNDSRKLLGIVSLHDLLKARVRNLEEESHRERVLTVRRLFPVRARRPPTSGCAE